MIIHMIYLLSILCAGQDSIQALKEVPESEITQRKIDELSEGSKNAQKLSNYLKSIGDIGKRQPGETESQFLQRVENGTKAQALLLIDLREEYEKLLQSRYELEILTIKYKKFLETENDDRMKSIMADEKTRENLDKAAKIEGAAMILIGRRLQEYLKNVEDSDEKKKIDDFEKNVLDFQDYANYPDSKFKTLFPDAIEKFKDKINKDEVLTPAIANEMIKFHATLKDIVGDKYTEMKILDEKISSQKKKDPMDDPNPARSKAIADGKKILEETRRLETQAHTVALLSKYVRLNLISLNTPGRNAQFRIDEFQTRQSNHANQLEQYLGVLTNSSNSDKKSPKELLDQLFK